MSALEKISLPIRYADVLLRHRNDRQLVIHEGRFKAIPAPWLVRAFCRGPVQRSSISSDLTIVLVHNRTYKTLMEQSLAALGIDDYVVLRADSAGPWRQTVKIELLREYLASGACRTEHVMFCDADDALMRDDPAIAVTLLERTGCEMLVSSTRYARHYGMAETVEWARSIAPVDMRSQRKPRIFLNSGVFVARTQFLREYIEAAAEYVTETDIPTAILSRMTDAEIAEKLPDAPHGIGCDQIIMRHLQPKFHPRMMIDYGQQLAVR